MNDFTFYLGSHLPVWIKREVDVPLFYSYRILSKVKNLFPAKNNIIIDSSAFSELSLNGKWTISEEDYIKEVHRLMKGIGNIKYACIQDYMCEPFIIEKTGMTVKQHQELTLKSYVSLSQKANDINWMPVIQGFKLDDYKNHVEMYYKNNIDLTSFKTVGVGSVCRRQHTEEIAEIMRTLYSYKIKIHGFGVKIEGLKLYKKYMISSDSMAWSRQARYEDPILGHFHLNCANCLEYALEWRNKVLQTIEGTDKIAGESSFKPADYPFMKFEVLK